MSDYKLFEIVDAEDSTNGKVYPAIIIPVNLMRFIVRFFWGHLENIAVKEADSHSAIENAGKTVQQWRSPYCDPQSEVYDLQRIRFAGIEIQKWEG
jgi:hypothetical protein